MRLSDGVEWGAHCAVVLAFLPADAALPTARLAEFHGVPAAYLAKQLQAMSRAGIVEATHGPRGGYRLARPPAEVSLLDVVEAIDGPEPAFRCTEIRRRGPAARPVREYRVQCGIHAAMDRADAAWREELGRVSIADLGAGLLGTTSPKALELGATWMQEVLS